MQSTAIPIAAPPAIKHMRVRLWGVQGSCPMFPEPHEIEEYKSVLVRGTIRRVLDDMRKKGGGGAISPESLLGGPSTDAAIAAYERRLGVADVPVYGGETTCISIETPEGDTVILDGGSGIRNGSKHLLREWGDRPRKLVIVTSHEHLDHRCGLPFCQFCFVRPAFDITVYGTRPMLDALDQRYGLFSRQPTAQMHYDDPVDFRSMPARFEGVELCCEDPAQQDRSPRPWRTHDPARPIEVGSLRIEPFDVYHGPTRCVAFRVRRGPRTFVFCTDHELRHGPDDNDPRQRRSLAAERRLAAQCRDADLVYFDGQYFLEEYLGHRGIGITAPVSRIDWGHGCIEDVVRRCYECRIRHCLIGHHDPERGWQERHELDQRLIAEHGGNCRIELAKSDSVIDL